VPFVVLLACEVSTVTRCRRLAVTPHAEAKPSTTSDLCAIHVVTGGGIG
jgi:hypothetical protein